MGKRNSAPRYITVFYAGSVVIGMETENGDQVWANLEVMTRQCRVCKTKKCVATCNQPSGPLTPLFSSYHAARNFKLKGRTGAVYPLSLIRNAVKRMPVEEDTEENLNKASGENRGRGGSGAISLFDHRPEMDKKQGHNSSAKSKNKRSVSGKGKKVVAAREPVERAKSCAEFMRFLDKSVSN